MNPENSTLCRNCGFRYGLHSNVGERCPIVRIDEPATTFRAADSSLPSEGVKGFCWTEKDSASHESDPHGIEQHTPGAKLDAGKNRVWLMLSGFSRALSAVSEVMTYGAKKYTDNGWKKVPNGFARYSDALGRHLLAEARGEARDKDTQILHAAHAAWNALARLELLLSEQDGKQSDGAAEKDVVAVSRGHGVAASDVLGAPVVPNWDKLPDAIKLQ